MPILMRYLAMPQQKMVTKHIAIKTGWTEPAMMKNFILATEKA
jgi:hypothetical protein